MYVLLALVAVSTAFVLITWVVVTAMRLYAPEVLPEEAALPGTWPAVAARKTLLPVGAHDIRSAQIRSALESAPPPYAFTCGLSDGLPSAWAEDLWLRRN